MADKTWTPATPDEVRLQLDEADRRTRQQDRAGPCAKAARYDAESGRIVVEFADGCLFAFPAELGQGLRHAADDVLAEVEVTPLGDGLHWERLDADLYIPSLLRGVFGTDRWMRDLGRAGGETTSAAKAAAARRNGRKGGRPRKR